MNTTLVVLRVLHIAAGVFWAGAIMFFGLFLEPSIRAAGPGGDQQHGQPVARRRRDLMRTQPAENLSIPQFAAI